MLPCSFPEEQSLALARPQHSSTPAVGKAAHAFSLAVPEAASDNIMVGKLPLCQGKSQQQPEELI